MRMHEHNFSRRKDKCHFTTTFLILNATSQNLMTKHTACLREVRTKTTQALEQIENDDGWLWNRDLFSKCCVQIKINEFVKFNSKTKIKTKQK